VQDALYYQLAVLKAVLVSVYKDLLWQILYNLQAKLTKLTKTDEFSSVFNFRKRLSSQHLSFHYQPNMLSLFRLGMVIGKKTQKLAVKRNYMRRVLRELMRKKQEQLLNFDIVIRIQKSFYRNDYDEIETEVDQMIARLKK
jgi:ribonuclease P protein component